MNARLYGLLAETSVHAGAGQSTGLVDLPFNREAATDYPVIPGSSVKGALRDLARQRTWEGGMMDRVFGKQESAGGVIVSDARLLLLPVRSMTSYYRWLTCPHLIERAARDIERVCGEAPELEREALAALAPGSYLGRDQGPLYLEERQFGGKGPVPAAVLALAHGLIGHEATGARLEDQLTVLHDHDFAWFARHGLAIAARNQLDEQKKTSENLWYEETLPPDSLLYLLLAERAPGVLDQVEALITGPAYVQMGGNETVGQGWFAVSPYQGGGQ